VAALLHRASRRRQQRLVSINCPALPDTLFESELFGHERGAFTGAAVASQGQLQAAHGGTVFFDEIADLSLTAQAKLLRTIEAHEISRLGHRTPIRLDLRFFSATNQDLAGLADEGRFRRDLYYRLKVCHLHLPPLRDRRSDIPELVEHFLSSFSSTRSRALECSGDAMAALVAYGWPGNVRELRNALEGLLPFVHGDRIDVDDLPECVRRPAYESADERGRILAALHGCRWNKRAAARQLHWSRMTLYRKLAKYGIPQTSSALRRVSRDMSPAAVTRVRD
jgi:DNA-binding NtrC family response regulator